MQEYKKHLSVYQLQTCGCVKVKYSKYDPWQNIFAVKKAHPRAVTITAIKRSDVCCGQE